jgi:hypothetical protein
MRDFVSVIGVDPGVTTGISVITVPVASLFGDAPAEITQFEYGEVTGQIPRQVEAIAGWVIGSCRGIFNMRPVMAAEDFDLDPGYHSRDKVLLFPVKVIGAIEYANSCNHFGPIHIELQSRSLAKSTAKDERLRAWGLYTTGSDHVRDGTRQSITMIRRLKQSKKLRDEVLG